MNERPKEKDSLASYVFQKFNEAFSAKRKLMDEWQSYWDAYNGDDGSSVALPDYKSNSKSNFIFSTLETVRPIMMDGRPKFEVVSTIEEAREYAKKIDFALTGEFYRAGVMHKLETQLITMLVTGNMVFYQPYNKRKKEIELIEVNPLNIFPDPMATNIDNAEYIIHAMYLNEDVLKKGFPAHASKIEGGNIQYAELAPKTDENERNVVNQVLVLEMWWRDYTKEENENVRQTIVCPELNLTLYDGISEYKDNSIPFTIIKCYEVPFSFWGVGDVKRLMSPQTQINELNNAVVDNAKHTANVPWIIDKNAGIPKGALTDRPGLIIRKNPGTEVSRPSPPNMPAYVVNKIVEFKDDIENISGVYSAMRGTNQQGVYTAQGILSLQEAGQARTRLKVKTMEDGMARMASVWVNRMKQFWKGDKVVKVLDSDGQPLFDKITREVLDYDYTIHIRAGSTMPMNKSAMFDLMIRLAQTPAEDGLPMADRRAVMEYMPGFDAKCMLERFEEINKQRQQDQLNEEEHVGKHTEEEGILEQLIKEVSAINQELLEVRKKLEEKDEEAELDKLKDDAYNVGYKDANEEVTTTEQESASIDESKLTPEVLEMIEGLDDAELMELLQEAPELEQLINSQMNMNNSSGTTM